MSKIKSIIQMPSVIRSEKFEKPPALLLIHQSDYANPAEYLLSKDAIKNKISCHFAWSFNADNFVQMVPLDVAACHTADPDNWFRAIGIVLPGPRRLPISDPSIKKLDLLVSKLLSLIPDIKHCCGYRHMSNCKSSPSDYFDFDKFCKTHSLKFGL